MAAETRRNSRRRRVGGAFMGSFIGQQANRPTRSQVSCRSAVPASPPLDRNAQATGLVASFRDLYPFAHHFLQTPAGAIHYVDEGPRNAPVLLCVHGNPSWSLLYRHLLTGLSDGLRCIAIDHLGCGLSDQPGEEDFGYRLADHVANLERLIVELDLRHITLVVHDWGGPIGTLAALRHLERLERLVITNTSLFPATRIPWRINVCRGRMGSALIRRGNAFARAATHMAVERSMTARLRKAYVTPYAGSRSALATWRFVEDIPMDEGHPSRSLVEELGASLERFEDLPTLLLWGEKDWCFVPTFRDELLRRMPWAKSVPLEDAGHYLFEDEPARIQNALSEFIQ